MSARWWCASGFMVRAPALPVETLDELPAELRRDALDPYVALAVAVASSSLAEALGRPLDGDRAQRLTRPVVAYLVRMASRATPFGLFAGVARGEWGDRTEIDLGGRPAVRRARPDMAWLSALVGSWERDPAVRANLVLTTHPTVRVRGGRVAVAGRDAGGEAAAVSLRATPVVVEALELCREGASRREVERALGRDPAKVQRMLDTLCDHGILTTSLRPSLTGSPASEVVEALRAAGEERAAGALARLLGELAAWERLADAEALRAWPGLVRTAREVESTPPAVRPSEVPPLDSVTSTARPASPPLGAAPAAQRAAAAAESAARAAQRASPAEPGNPAGQCTAPPGELAAARPTPARPTSPQIQVDARFDARACRLPRAVAGEAARAVELLWRLSPVAGGRSSVDRWRERFEGLYGHDRPIPVLELVDRGLPEPAHGPAPLPARDRVLLRLAGDALRCDRTTVELDEDLVARVEAAGGPRGRPPRSVDLFCSVAATSAAELDAGRFLLVAGSATSPAGRSFGRFGHLFEPGDLQFLDEVPAAGPGTVSAELLFEPLAPGSGNVMVRAPRARHAIHLGGPPPGGAIRAIPLDELAVILTAGSLRLVWPREGVRVVASSSHMLNYRLAPRLAAFLHEVSTDGEAPLGRFSWGSAEHLPSLPRLQSGRVVLRRAEWALDEPFLDAYRSDSEAALRDGRVPSSVLLGGGDGGGHLLLDLSSDAGAALLLAAANRLGPGERLRVLEPLPGREHAFARSHDGRRLIELTVAVASRERAAVEEPVPRAVAARRGHPPGSEWLYAKLYLPRDLADDLIGGPLLALTRDLTAAGAVSSWFFVRYADPAFHVRLRLRGDPPPLDRVCGWARELMDAGLLDRFALDTYEPETERYGGPLALPLAERAFAADSVAAAELIAARPNLDRTLLGALAVDDLLDALGLDRARRLDWYEAHHDVHAHAKTYRPLKDELRALLSHRTAPPDVERILSRRRAALEGVGGALEDLDLWLPLPRILRAIVHMHCNRLHPDGPATEPVVLGLAGLATASLIAAPLPRVLDTDPLHG